MKDARERFERKARKVAALAALVACTAGPARAADAPAKDEGVSSGPRRDQGPENPATYEFAFVSAGLYQAWAIAGRSLFFGAGGGVGPPLYRYSKFTNPEDTKEERDRREAGWDPTLEVAYGNLFLRFSPIRYLDLDVGPKIAIVSLLFNTKDTHESGFSYGGYADLRVGSPTIKVGPRFEYDRIAYSDYYETGWRFTPLMLRVTH